MVVGEMIRRVGSDLFKKQIFFDKPIGKASRLCGFENIRAGLTSLFAYFGQYSQPEGYRHKDFHF